MTTITLQPITIKFEHTEEFDVGAYLEYCEDYDIEPSQKHFKRWAFDCMVDSLTDDIDTDKFVISYGNSEKIESGESEDDVENYSNPCPECGTQLKCAPGGGVKCPNKDCDYWFCY